jgi:CDP-4-dehydro-6-deoxyglucose reductase
MIFRVKIANTDLSFEVNDDETILDAALRQGIEFPYSCYSGICTTCLGKVESGKTTYANNEIYGIDPDNAEHEVLFCSAYAQSDLLISHPEFTSQAMERPKTIACRVIAREILNNAIIKIRLQPKLGTPFAYKPGQYLELQHGGKSYPLSIASHPDDEFIELHLLNADYSPLPEGLNSAINQHDEVVIHGPLGNAYLREDSAAPILLVAGGSGFAPMKSIIQHLISKGSRRTIHLFWGARSPQFLYLHEPLRLWDKHIANFHYTPVISEPSHQWQGLSALVHQQVLAHYDDLSDYDIYLAGPIPMLRVAREDFLNHQANEARMFSDGFALLNAQWD